MTDDELVRRLDTVIGILRIAHEDAITRVRNEVRKDKAYAAILDLAADWTPAGTLRTTVVKLGQSPRTFGNKTAELVERGLLERRGAGPTVAYRTTGLV
jgi:hypothetical protein